MVHCKVRLCFLYTCKGWFFLSCRLQGHIQGHILPLFF